MTPPLTPEEALAMAMLGDEQDAGDARTRHGAAYEAAVAYAGEMLVKRLSLLGFEVRRKDGAE